MVASRGHTTGFIIEKSASAATLGGLSSEVPKSEHGGLFPPTAWSQIQAGSGTADSSVVAAALDEICRRYWEPARKYLRALGCGAEDAEDIAQTFFANWAKPEKLKDLAPERGRLRSYLKMSLKRHFISHWRHGQAERRGGGVKPVALEDAGDPADNTENADLDYDRAWAEAVLNATLAQLRASYVARGREKLFDLLVDGLPGGIGMKPYAEIGVLADVKETQVKIEVHRLRRRFGETLRAEVSATLADTAELEDELRHLMRVMAHTHGDPS